MFQENAIDAHYYLAALERVLAQELPEEVLPDALALEACCLSRLSFDRIQ
jgi:hypothetical protein